ncbi:MAG TPA: hypothetical protein VM077_06245 [Candidatus Limnocylindrales bacterium]|nr:hypothetical protein [Candidatus Limnocylindrales bacterium]
MGGKEISIPINKTTYTENGARYYVVTVSTHQQKTSTNSTAVHEAQHAVTAILGGTDVIDVSIIKSGNALGVTRLSRFDAAAAMAPHAHGSSGTWSDVSKVEYFTGNSDAAASAAKSMLSGQTHSVNAVAVRLEEERIIDGHTVKRIMQEADTDKELGHKKVVDIYVKSSDGTERKMTQEIRGENVIFDTAETERDKAPHETPIVEGKVIYSNKFRKISDDEEIIDSEQHEAA